MIFTTRLAIAALLLGLVPAASAAERAAAVEAPPGKKYVYKQSAGKPREMEVYFPPKHDPAKSKAPGILLFHGGGWSGGDLRQFRNACQYFASRGLVAATAEYQMLDKKAAAALVGNESKKRVCIIDARSAIRWFKQHAGELGIDPARIITGGGSAGGHVSVLATLNAGLNDPADPKDFDCSVVAYVLFNPAFSPQDDADPEVDVLRHLKPGMAPAIAFFGTMDSWKKGWDAAREKLKSLGQSKVEEWNAEGLGHGFFNRQPWQDVTLTAADEFLARHGLLEGKPTLAAPKTGEKLVQK